MSEHTFEAVIGSEIEVTVQFDYVPEEAETEDYPGCLSEVLLNLVCVDGDPDKDIVECLSDSQLDALKEKADEALSERSREQYESAQEEC